MEEKEKESGMAGRQGYLYSSRGVQTGSVCDDVLVGDADCGRAVCVARVSSVDIRKAEASEGR
jgi:hypothetical protein